MTIATKGLSKLVRWRHGAHKLRWGLRTVGAGATLRGAGKLAWVYLRRPSRAEVRLKSGCVLEFAFPGQVPPALLMFGDLIDPEFAFLKRAVPVGAAIVDVGAAIGQFALFAASLPSATVHAFEPSHANVSSLTSNIRRNGVEARCFVHKIALSDAEGEAPFATAARSWMSNLSDDQAVDCEMVPVRTVTGEMRRLGLERVSVLKINVSGFEPKVLAGAREFLERQGADVLILLLGLSSLPIYETISRCQYRFFYYHPKENALYEISKFDADSVLNHRPWPARHIIAIRNSALQAYSAGMILHPSP